MPRKTRTRADLLRSLRRLEEGGEMRQVLVPELRERGHRRARVDAARALEVGDLELLALVLRALGGEVGRTEVRRAGAVVGVTREAAGLREERRAGDRLLVVLEALLLR